jgi:hypothetical protein
MALSSRSQLKEQKTPDSQNFSAHRPSAVHHHSSARESGGKFRKSQIRYFFSSYLSSAWSLFLPGEIDVEMTPTDFIS